MQQAPDELRKLITQLSSRVYSMQAVASKFRLTAAEIYHERLRGRYLKHWSGICYRTVVTTSDGWDVDDGIYMNDRGSYMECTVIHMDEEVTEYKVVIGQSPD